MVGDVSAVAAGSSPAWGAPGAAAPSAVPPRWTQSFDEVLVRQVLRQAAAWRDNSAETDGSAGWRELADDHLARALAGAGGLGIGRQLWSSMRATQAYQQAAREP